MQSMPILKFEKSTNYLNNQLNTQLNNKKLISNILSTINSTIQNDKNIDNAHYLNIQASAKLFLETISQNITTIEELNREIKHITYDLTEVLSETNKKEKSKEYYIVAISSVKTNIENYTSKFQAFEKKIEQNNLDFAKFIDSNNFKFNITAKPNDDSYEFSGVSLEVPEKSESENTDLETEINSPKKVTEKEADEKNEEEILEDDSTTPNIVIDYNSIYSNYFKNSASIEENILSEYSSFDFAPSKSNSSNTKNGTLFVLENDDENLENGKTNEPIVDEIEIIDNNTPNSEVANEEIQNNETELLEKIDDTNGAETEEITYDDISISDDDLLEELLKDDNILDTANNSEFDSIINSNNLVTESSKESVNSEENIFNNTAELTETQNKNESISEKIVAEPKLIDLKTKSKPKKINNIFSEYNLEEKIKSIVEGLSNNDTLIISERKNKVFLPYTIDEVEKYLKIYPDIYISATEVITKEFILPFSDFFKFPAQARFAETYNLIRNRQEKSLIYSLMYSFKLIFKSNLNPAVIAACKSEDQLQDYLQCLNTNKLDKFNDFKIIYDVNLSKQVDGI